MSTIQVAVVHYHLRPGGVTRVIAETLAALSRHRVRVVVLSGTPPAMTLPEGAVVRVVEELNYTTGEGARPESLVRCLQAAARSALKTSPDIWHCHNHALGRNPSLTQAVFKLAERGHRVLLQLHDFVEDGRPEVYRAMLSHMADNDRAMLTRYLYPQSPHVHYALMNSRDRDLLIRAGAPARRCHWLPNPVCFSTSPASEPHDGAGGSDYRILYPTRAIRRKNLGEFLLWAAVAPEHQQFATTLAPTSPSDRTTYMRWKRLATKLRLPIEFEVGKSDRRSFPELVRAACAVATTSVAEGFGLAFLEPWLMDRPVVGRDLPEITADFKAEGLRFPGLYEHLWVPLEWIGVDRFRHDMRMGLRKLYAAYGHRLRSEEVERGCSAMICNDHLDFGRLNELQQAQVVCLLAESPEARRSIIPLALEFRKQGRSLISQNRRIITTRYDSEHYGDRLGQIYESLLNESPGSIEALPGEAVLRGFLNPERYCPLRY